MVLSHTWDRVFVHHLADQVQSFCDFHWEVVSILQVLHQHLLFDQLCLRLLVLCNFFDLITAVVMWRILTVLTWAWTYTAHLFVSSTEDTRETGTVQGILTLLSSSHSDTFQLPGSKIQILPSDLATESQHAVEHVPVLQCDAPETCQLGMWVWNGMGTAGVNSIKCWWG